MRRRAGARGTTRWGEGRTERDASKASVASTCGWTGCQVPRSETGSASERCLRAPRASEEAASRTTTPCGGQGPTPTPTTPTTPTTTGTTTRLRMGEDARGAEVEGEAESPSVREANRPLRWWRARFVQGARADSGCWRCSCSRDCRHGCWSENGSLASLLRPATQQRAGRTRPEKWTGTKKEKRALTKTAQECLRTSKPRSRGGKGMQAKKGGRAGAGRGMQGALRGSGDPVRHSRSGGGGQSPSRP